MKYLSTLFLLTTTLLLNAQSFWSDANETALIFPRNAQTVHVPEQRRALELAFDEMTQYLSTAPEMHQGVSGIIFELPMPNGEMESFEVFSSNIMEAPLIEKYPNIRSFKAVSIDHPGWTGRFDYSIWGFNASIKTDKGDVYIQPMASEQQLFHYSYYIGDYRPDEIDMSDFICGTKGNINVPQDEKTPSVDLRSECDPWPLKRLRLALACTGEWGGSSSLGGGTKEKALAKMNSSINRVNQIYENEIGVQLVLIGANDKIIFLDGATDPYRSADQGGTLLGQNTGILNTFVFFNSYDIGHIFTGRCSDVGGVAFLGSVCQSTKGAGVTCWYTSSVEYVTVNIVCHEMGHQFGAPHTFNNCNGQGNATGFEPGGGSTIMSYNGLCGAQSYVRQADPYYHTNSLINMVRFTREGGAKECGEHIDMGNTRPEVQLDYEDDFYIPILTPFELEGKATDCEDDPLTYAWEQYNAGNIVSIGEPKINDGDVPLFRPIPPQASPKRTFPNLSHILYNNNNSPIVDKSEVLPYYSRNFTFVFTVRDNHPGVGASNWGKIEFKVSNLAGPFKVLNPERNEVVVGGTYKLIKWDVANTDQEPVNCKEVDIFMYANGDYDNPILLAENTANDGSEYILFPNENIQKARIKIKASDNIFFDISNNNFSIEKSESPEVSVGLFPNYLFVCTPDLVSIDINSTSLNGADDEIKIISVDNVPADINAQLSDVSFGAGEGIQLELDMMDYHENGIFEFDITYQIGDGDTLNLGPVKIEALKNDYYNLALISPKDTKGGSTGPTFVWSGDSDADVYTFEIATSPSFSDNTLVRRTESLTKTSFRMPLLDVNTIYYWRVRGENICGPGPWTETFVFSTIAQSCSTVEILDKKQVISTRRDNKFYINFDQAYSISDVNIPNIAVNINYIEDMSLYLYSPEGSKVTLWDRECYTSSAMDLGFDDEAPRSPVCPPTGKGSYQPLKDTLSKFIGENALGEWMLEAKLSPSARSGKLLDWQLEVCGDIQITPPTLIRNDTLRTPPNESNTIATANLEADDPNGDNNALLYTLIGLPKNGVLKSFGTSLKIGDQFQQSALSAWGIQYEQIGDHDGADSFEFIVQDEEGGWTGVHHFNILIDDEYVVSTNDIKNPGLSLNVTPNPAYDFITVHASNSGSSAFDIVLYNAHGQIVYSANEALDKDINIDVQSLKAGLYFIQVRNEIISGTTKVIIQH